MAQQDDSQELYNQARSNFEIGRITEALQLLKDHENRFPQNFRQRVYRLISLCYLAQDSTDQAEDYASLLLRENSYYSSVDDPVRFEDMIARLRSEKEMTITTASSKEERIAEAPVPVTIITSEMIEMLGYNKNIGQILSAFVPGIAEVASNNSDNVAIHGAYTSNQEKILIMEDGHRINSRSTNIGRVDYALDTKKIDHIEVLRGPASSLYGNVALTAVVNIITKKGSQVNGFSANYGYGSFGTHKANILFGSRLLDADILAWASFYTSKGQERYIESSSLSEFVSQPSLLDGGYAHINKYSNKPSYDVGLNINYGNFW